ncbi:MAG: glycosyltransferase family 4 protein [Actinobacteria bacterium]|nr:glycosyltransferase family 4 protein [Actinomycetota bacterium]
MTGPYGATVAIVQSWLTPYRLPFYDLLRAELSERSIDLKVVYGQAGREEATKRHHTDLPWGTYVANRYFTVRGKEASWQPCLGAVEGADLIIVEQALKRLVNLALLAQQLLGTRRVAFWGHGRNFQPHRGWPGVESTKRRVSRQAHWWFAYNELSARAVEDLPYPVSRITVVNNSVDTRSLRSAREALTDQAVAALRSRLGIRSDRVGLFVGGMYPDKRLSFLLECCERIRGVVPDFELVLVGDGPDAPLVEAASRRYQWIHWDGPCFGADLAPYFAAARVFLMPGLVGLGVLDSFAFGLPLVTCDLPYHSPEVDYLAPGVNAVVVTEAHDHAAYENAVVELLEQPATWARLARAASAAASSYGIEAMARRFAIGVEQALDAA